MPRIVGVDVPNEKRVEIALTYVYGIGRHNVREILDKAAIEADKRARELTGEEIARLTRILDKYVIEGELRKTIRDNIERLKSIGAYRGARHIASLPARGQRTRTNARTKRGKRMTIGAIKKEEAPKVTSEQKK